MKLEERLELVGATRELKNLVRESNLSWEERESLDFILSSMGKPHTGTIAYIERMDSFKGICSYLQTFNYTETKKYIFVTVGEEGEVCRKMYIDLFNENKRSSRRVNSFKAGLRTFFIYMRTARMDIPGYNFTKDPTNFSMVKVSTDSMNENLL